MTKEAQFVNSRVFADQALLLQENHPIGKKLKRMHRFHTHAGDMDISSWMSFVEGFNNFFHHKQAVNRGEDLLFCCENHGVSCTKFQKEEFLLAQAIHDTPEALTGIDVSRMTKTNHDRQCEYRLYARAASALFSHHPVLLHKARHAISHVLGSQDSLLGNLHFCLTLLGHIEDAYEAKHKAEELKNNHGDLHSIIKLEGVYEEVIPSSTKELTMYLGEKRHRFLRDAVNAYLSLRNIPLILQ